MPAKQAQVKTIRSTPSQVRAAVRLPASFMGSVRMAGGLLPVAARLARPGRVQAADAVARHHATSARRRHNRLNTCGSRGR